jgi:hypothetical protein
MYLGWSFIVKQPTFNKNGPRPFLCFSRILSKNVEMLFTKSCFLPFFLIVLHLSILSNIQNRRHFLPPGVIEKVEIQDLSVK